MTRKIYIEDRIYKENKVPYTEKIREEFKGTANFVILKSEGFHIFEEFSSYTKGYKEFLRNNKNILIVYRGTTKKKTVRELIIRAIGELNKGEKVDLERVLL
ncbi:MAG: hypothetical protein AABW81_00560 [Nanoarchaeota archaeon]